MWILEIITKVNIGRIPISPCFSGGRFLEYRYLKIAEIWINRLSSACPYNNRRFCKACWVTIKSQFQAVPLYFQRRMVIYRTPKCALP